MSSTIVKIIYSTHARERIKKRQLSFWSIEDTLTNPNKKYACDDGGCKYIKQQGSRRYHVVAKYLPDQHAHLVISAWVRGEEDQPDWLWRIITLPFKLTGKLIVGLFKLARRRR